MTNVADGQGAAVRLYDPYAPYRGAYRTVHRTPSGRGASPYDDRTIVQASYRRRTS
jgi:hypothetical protein